MPRGVYLMKNHRLVIAATAMVVFAFAPLGAHAGAPAFPWGQIVVAPNTGLVDGQTVQVSGTDFQKNTELRIVECGPTQGIPPVGGFVTAICTDYSVVVTTDAEGNFAVQSFTVSTLIQGSRWSHGHNVPATYDCLVANDCHIHVFADVTGTGSANQDISFGLRGS
jgi:Neocarzinostatin family